MKNFIFIFLILSPFSSFAQNESVAPLSATEFTCISSNQNWQIFVNVNLGAIQVFNAIQNKLSHQIEGLRNDSKDGKVKLYNFRGKNGLPGGVIFEADLKVSGINAFSIDDMNASRTLYSCKK